MSVDFTSPPDYEIHVPVLIAGGGACGLVAGLAASDAGATALVLEQDAEPAGSTAMSYGAICAAGTEAQQDAGVDDRAEWLIEDILAITRGETDADLARVIATGAGPAIEWLMGRHGIALTVETSWTGMGHRRPRLHAPADRSGRTLMNQLQEAVAAAGVDVVTSAKVSAVFADSTGRVSGVAVSRPDGAVETIGCDTLIIATCGFGANPDMIAEHLPRMRDARYYGHEGNRGDGIAWGLALGGAVADMGAYQALGSLADPQSIVIPHTLLIGGGVQVNLRGERFENELKNISGQALTILEQPDGVCWIVYDERLHAAALERFAEYRDAAEVRACKTASTIDELAATCKLPASELSATLDRVARLALDNETDEFGRRFNANEILTPPYYAIRVTGALFHTQGGLCVDGDARVVTPTGDPLPNVYAGGGAARSVSGPGEWGYLPGMGLCTAVTLGRIAGDAAARQALR